MHDHLHLSKDDAKILFENNNLEEAKQNLRNAKLWHLGNTDPSRNAEFDDILTAAIDEVQKLSEAEDASQN